MEGRNDEAARAREREAATHGCCCKCCSLRAEIWVCFVIDLTTILGLAVEIPGWAPVPASLHAVELFQAYVVFSGISACLILFALLEGQQAAWPRHMLVRFMTLKLPIFIVTVFGYFSPISPWAQPLAQWSCENDFQKMRTAMGGEYETCVQMFSWIWTMNNAPYIFAYAYTIKASYEWFRCHPGNDDKHIWWSRATPVREGDEYANLEDPPL